MSLHLKNLFKGTTILSGEPSVQRPQGTRVRLSHSQGEPEQQEGTPSSPRRSCTQSQEASRAHTLRSASTRHAVVMGPLRLEVKVTLSAFGGTGETEAPAGAAVLQSELSVAPSTWGWRGGV